MLPLLMPWFIFSWIGFLALRTVFILLGWIVVPIATLCEAYRCVYDRNKYDKNENPYVYHFTWKWMFIWDNWEDGIANDMYWKAPNLFLQILYWSCLRNPANNLRRVKYLSLKIDPEKVRWIGGPHALPESYDTKPPRPEWFICWCGLYSCVWRQFEMFGSVWRFWLGWKIFPEDKNGVTGHRSERAGFATQFKEVD